jgi:hypothetical protein
MSAVLYAFISHHKLVFISVASLNLPDQNAL